MARKPHVFRYIRDDQDETPREPPDRPNRNAARLESRELAALAVRLCHLPPNHVAALPLDPLLIEELEMLRGSGQDSGRRRQLKCVVGLLRDADVAALQRELDGHGIESVRLHGIERWRARIIAEGDPAIQDFVATHEGVDRGQVRALARQAGGEDAAAARASKRLFAVLKKATDREPTDVEPTEAESTDES